MIGWKPSDARIIKGVRIDYCFGDGLSVLTGRVWGGIVTIQSAVSASAMLNAAAARLLAAGIDTPRNDAKLLLAEAYAVTPADVEKAVLLGRPLAAPFDRPAESGRIGSDISIGAESPCTAQADTTADGHDDKGFATAAYQRFEAMIERRERREPLQYIVGHAPFRYLDLQVGPGVFIPRPETETVVQVAIDWLANQWLKAPRLVDLCAGSGAIGLALATEVRSSQVWAVERSDDALQWARRNEYATFGCSGDSKRGSVRSRRSVKDGSFAAPSGKRDGAIPGDAPRAAMADRGQSMGSVVSDLRCNYRLIQGDATDATTLAELDGTVDAVVTNPPYIPADQIPQQPEVRDHDPAEALYGGSVDGLCIPERILLRAANLLRTGGALIMEHDSSQGDSLVAFAVAHGFVDAHTGEDLTGRSRYLFAVRR